MFSTPFELGSQGVDARAVAGFVLKPWEARLTPSPPDGWPTTLWLRMIAEMCFVYRGVPNVLVSPKLISCARP